MTNRRPAPAAVPFLALALAGCPGPVQPRHEIDPARPLENKFEKELQFPDIPVPRNFRQDRESWTKVYIEKGNVRLALLVYHGNAFPKDVVDFYNEYMVNPANGWKKVRDELIKGSGAIFLVFQKSRGEGAPEECQVLIRRENRVTTISIGIEVDVLTQLTRR